MDTTIQKAVEADTGTAMLRTHQIARLSGIGYRQIDYWTRRGIITPAVEANGSGTQRRFTLRQASVFCVLARLRRCGIDLDRMRLVARALEGAETLDGWLVLPLDAAGVAIVNDDQLAVTLSYMGGAIVVELAGEVDAQQDGDGSGSSHDHQQGES